MGFVRRETPLTKKSPKEDKIYRTRLQCHARAREMFNNKILLTNKRLLSSRDYMYRKRAEECLDCIKKKIGESIYREKD